MYDDILQLINHIRRTIEVCSSEFKFKNHTNNISRNIDQYYADNDLNNDIPKIISCKDLIYFTCMQSLTNNTYSATNNIMIHESLTNVSDDAYKKQRKRKSYELFKKVFYSLVDFSNLYCKKNNLKAETFMDLIEESQNINKLDVLIQNAASVDGTHVTTAKNLAKDGLKHNVSKSSCMITISTILDHANKIPCNIKTDKAMNEIKSFIEQLDEIKKYYIFLFDRNYFCKNILQSIIDHKCDAVFRLSTKYSFVKEFLKSKLNDKIIYIKDGKRVGCRLKSTIKVRLIKYTINDNLYILCTTLTDANKYNLDFLKKLYHERWQIEEFYKILNHNLGFKKSKAKTLNTLQQEMYAKLIIIAISRIIRMFSLKCHIKLKSNEAINFNDCMKITMNGIFKSLIYDPIHINTSREICRHIQIVRKSTVKCEPNRHYNRIAVRTVYKWYYLGRIRGNQYDDNNNNG